MVKGSNIILFFCELRDENLLLSTLSFYFAITFKRTSFFKLLYYERTWFLNFVYQSHSVADSSVRGVVSGSEAVPDRSLLLATISVSEGRLQENAKALAELRRCSIVSSILNSLVLMLDRGHRYWVLVEFFSLRRILHCKTSSSAPSTPICRTTLSSHRIEKETHWCHTVISSTRNNCHRRSHHHHHESFPCRRRC